MDGGNEQRVAIKFSFKAGLSAKETLDHEGEATTIHGSIWNHQTCRWQSGAQVESGLSPPELLLMST